MTKRLIVRRPTYAHILAFVAVPAGFFVAVLMIAAGVTAWASLLLAVLLIAATVILLGGDDVVHYALIVAVIAVIAILHLVCQEGGVMVTVLLVGALLLFAYAAYELAPRSPRAQTLMATAFLLCLGLGGAGALYVHARSWVWYAWPWVWYDNCGEITFTEPLSLAPPDPRNPPRWQAAETCLWQHYLEGKRVMLTVVRVGEISTSTTLFTVDPADQAAPIHGEMTFRGVDRVKYTATCRAMGSTTIGLEMEGCSGDTGEVITQNFSIGPSTDIHY